MIQLFQEAIPFSNKRVDASASQDGTFLNPIIMPFAINATLGSNIFETVIYIRNSSIEHFYKDVIVTLMKESGNGTSTSSGRLRYDGQAKKSYFSINTSVDIETSIAFPYIVDPPTEQTIDGQYIQNYVIVVDDPSIAVKFSYGYDEVSALDWETQKPAIVIPMIGNSTTPDTSYIPIRMRIEFKESPSVFTIRDYFIDITYTTEGEVA